MGTAGSGFGGVAGRGMIDREIGNVRLVVAVVVLVEASRPYEKEYGLQKVKAYVTVRTKCQSLKTDQYWRSRSKKRYV